MINEQELPDSIIERTKMMERALIDSATGGGGALDDAIYVHLRREFMNNHKIKSLLPDFVRIYRSLGAFWPFIKNEAATYASGSGSSVRPSLLLLTVWKVKTSCLLI